MVSEENFEITRLQFSADAMVLRTICNPAATESLDSIIKEQTRRRGREYYRLCNGFKWLVGAAAYSLLEDIIQTPELLGLDWVSRVRPTRQ